MASFPQATKIPPASAAPQALRPNTGCWALRLAGTWGQAAHAIFCLACPPVRAILSIAGREQRQVRASWWGDGDSKADFSWLPRSCRQLMHPLSSQ